MAIIKKNILGTLQGSLTNVVFRVRNGKLVAYTRPSKQKISKSKAAVKSRNKFALTVALAKTINADDILSKVWNQSKIIATNGFQKLIKYNSAFTDSHSLTLKNVITPEGIKLNHVTVSYSDNLIELSINCDKLERELLKANKLCCLVYLWNQNDINSIMKSKTGFNLKLYNFNLTEMDSRSSLNFLIDISLQNKPRYDNGIVFIAMVGEKNNKFFWSSTLSNKFL